MWRRVVYVVIGIVTVNLVLMAVMLVQASNEDDCDTSARGLVVWDDEREFWETIQVPSRPTDLPPCRGTFETVIKVSSG